MKKFLPLVILLFHASFALSATYYVDNNHPQANDQNPGTIVQPFKTINYGVSKLQPGDTLLVRKGVYYESVTVKVNGTEGNRITIKAYEGEKVVLDGRKPVKGWAPCTSSKECAGNLNFNHLYHTKIDADDFGDVDRISLFEGDYFLRIARDPDQSDPTRELVDDYRPLTQESYGLTDGLIDSDYLIQRDDFWNGTHVKIWSHAYNNAIINRKVASFSRRESKIIFDTPLDHPISEGSQPDGYSFVNHPWILDKTGEFYVNEVPDPSDGKLAIYLWPYKPDTINEDIFLTQHSVGFYIYHGGSHVTIDGFEIRNFGVGSGTREGGILCPYGLNHNNLIIRNCIIHDLSGYGGISLSSADHDTVENNVVYNVLYGKGIYVGGGSRHTIKGNYVKNVQGTAICCFGTHQSKIIYNTASLTGNHGNGLTTYLGCRDMLIAGNKVAETGANYTLQESTNVTIYNNVFYGRGRGGYLIANWSWMGGYMRIFNNTVIDSSNNASLLLGKADPITCKNNILDGGGAGDLTHNVFVDLSWNQNTDVISQNNQIEKDVNNVFVNYAGSDYSQKADGPAYRTGTDISSYFPTDIFPEFDFNTDINGNPLDLQNGPHIGAYVPGPISFDLPDYIEQTLYPSPEHGVPLSDYPKELTQDVDITHLFFINNVLHPSTNKLIEFRLVFPIPEDASITILNVKGEKIITLFSGRMDSGETLMTWDGRNDKGSRVSSGIYLLRLETNKKVEQKKIAVIK